MSDGYLYGHAHTGRVEHMYVSSDPVSGLCSAARRISPVMTDVCQLGDVCRLCQRRAAARREKLFCLVCGGERVYLSKRTMRPDLVVCDDCGAQRTVSAVKAARKERA
jgi:hypothetical protein